MRIGVEGTAYGALRVGCVLARATVFTAVVVALAGCTAVQIGEPYDKEIDTELNAYQKLTTEFIKSTQQTAAVGQYTSNESKKYYSTAAATLSNVQIRADLLSDRQCPTARVGQIVGSLGFSAVDSAIGQAESGLGGTLTDELDVSGNCIAITVRGVRLAHDNLEADHREVGRLTPGVAQLNLLAIDAAVRVSLRAVRAKDY